MEKLISLERLVGSLKCPKSARELIREGRKNKSKFDSEENE